jgi:hypothetical protein
MPHVMLSQVAFPPLAGAGQTLSQLPQWVGDVLRSTHIVPHWVGADVAHEFVHPDAEQIGVPAEQVFPHTPQFMVVVALVSQPSSGLELQ